MALRLFALLLAATLPAAALEEKHISRKDLPPAVEKALASQPKDARYILFEREVEDGKTFYEVKLKTGGRARTLLFEPDGTLFEVEQEVPFESLPPAVKAGLSKQAGDRKMGLVLTITKRGKLVSYAAFVTRGKAKSEVRVSPEGRPVPLSD